MFFSQFFVGWGFSSNTIPWNQHAPIGFLLNDFEDITPNRSCFCFKIVFLTLAFASGYARTTSRSVGIPVATQQKPMMFFGISNQTTTTWISNKWYDVDPYIFSKQVVMYLEITEGTPKKEEITFQILCRLGLTLIFCLECWPNGQRLAELQRSGGLALLQPNPFGAKLPKRWRQVTPQKSNTEPENTPLEEENHLPNHHFQFLC